MHRLFVPPEEIESNKIIINGEPLKKIRAVLRLKPHDQLCIFDGRGHEYVSQIISLSTREAELKIITKQYPDRESAFEVHVGQAVPKSDKMKFVIQKAVELGAYEFHPFYSSRTVPTYDKGQLAGRLRRWQKISQEAAQQSGRTMVPWVNPPVEFSQLLAVSQQSHLRIILHGESAKEPLKQILTNERRGEKVFFIVGPEGGFAPEELRLAQQYGFESVRLGARILRTETAALTFLSILQYEWGGMY
ncbi:MAG: 16S rRNA (uracil(1498)-N(3))-methyltransferase [Deltaproteobacteria bacterium]|nr:16S rRNA (uracil(1498)-N(3))-methyltransferase [Deltaproteobacteria bacterium]